MGATRGAAIRARQWGWTHAGRARAAVSGLDLNVEPGERVLLLGASGAGKSTLLRGLAGVLGGEDEGQESGELAVDGRSPRDVRGVAGLMLQDPDNQVVLARVGDDVAFACENLGVPRDEIWQRVHWAVRAVGLDVPLDHPTTRLSGGQTQRLVLAGILAMRPRLLLLDEPTASLDPDGVREVRDVVARVAAENGLTLVVVEHRVDVWQHVADRVIVLGAGGGVEADGPTREVLTMRGAELARRGIWVPEHPPRVPKRAERAGGAVLMEASDLAVGRRAFGRKTPDVAASGLTLSLREGTGTAVTGPNGAGKTTLALTLAGLLEPVSGSVAASDVLAAGLPPEPIRWRSRDLLTRIGTVFQQPEHQFLTPTVRRELRVGPEALGLSDEECDARVDELLSRLRLDHLASANPFTLSGGEKRRLSVATALATRPSVLVLDEPTFGQDAITWRELLLLLRELIDDGRAVVAVTHDRPLVEAIADAELSVRGREAVVA